MPLNRTNFSYFPGRWFKKVMDLQNLDNSDERLPRDLSKYVPVRLR